MIHGRGRGLPLRWLLPDGDRPDAVEQEGEARERGIRVSTDLRPAPVAGSPVLIERLTANLVQNAIRHSPPGAEAMVRTGRRDEHSFLEVENPGKVLRQYEVDELFEPFRRGDGRTTSSGAGLGLSIVRSVAQAHDGRVSAYPREGGGLVVRVELPASPGQAGMRSRTS